MVKRRKNVSADKNLKLWTIVCLVLVCVAAIALRGFIVYSIYPLEYADEIKAASAEYSLDKYTVSAVICAESHFDKDAVSRTGAAGLMQLMPATAEWAAEKMGLDNYTEEMLYDPETNITLGCWYLKYLSGLFGGDKRKVIAAYNAGPANVQDWIDSGQMNDIPFEDTKKYLETVQRNYDIYKGLYPDF